MPYRSQLIAAAVALFAAASAQAVTVVSLGNLSTPQTKTLPSQSIEVGSFSYDFTFTTSVADIFSADALSYKVLGATSGLSSFSASIDGQAFAASSGTSLIGNRTAFTDTLSYSAGNALVLAAGNPLHHLLISGTAVKAATLNGSFNLVAAPVPETETYALMLAGLGVVGLLSARRRQA